MRGAVVVGRTRRPWIAGVAGLTVLAGLVVAGPARAVGAGPAELPAGRSAEATMPALGTIWALDRHSIVGYPPGSNDNVPPTTTISGSRAGIGSGAALVVTATGALWVSDADSDVLKEFAPGATGDVAPVATIGGSMTMLHSPAALALSGSGDLWILNDDPSDTTASLIEFAPGAHGNVAPIERIAGAKTRLFPSVGIALTTSGNQLWVTHVGGGQRASSAIQEFATSTPGNVAAIRTITGSRTELAFPYGVTLDRSGEVIVSDDGNGGASGAILTFSPKSTGNVAPARVLSGVTTGISEPSYLALDAGGKIWEPNYQAGSLGRFVAVAAGDLPPDRSIAGDKTGLDLPNAIAVYSTKPGVPRALAITPTKHGRFDVSWRAPSDNGGGLIGYKLFEKISTHGRWTLATQSTLRSFVTGKLPTHTRIYFDVAAFNEDGASPRTPPVSRVS
jgi:hypothetical protein